MSTSSSAIRVIVLVAAVWGASPAVAEVTFRLLGAVPPTDLEGLYEQLPDGNYKHRAGVNADADWFAAKFSIHTDGFGFRCDEQRQYAAKPNEPIDLLIIGDSQGYGQGVDFDASLAG